MATSGEMSWPSMGNQMVAAGKISMAAVRRHPVGPGRTPSRTRQPRKAIAWYWRTPASHQGLLEARCAERCSPVHRRARAQRCALAYPTTRVRHRRRE